MTVKRWIQDPVTHKLVPAEEYVRPEHREAPMVMGDIQPYKSMVTGEMITSRSRHRDHLKRHNVIEVGNEINYMLRPRKKVKLSNEARKRRIAEILNSRGG